LVINISAKKGCLPCQSLNPYFNEFANKNSNKNVKFIQGYYSELFYKDSEVKTKYKALLETDRIPTTFIIKKTRDNYILKNKIIGNKHNLIKKKIKKIKKN
jgi:thiol-disulfide isomerase/thioredoxin